LERKSRSGPTAYVSPVSPMPVVSEMRSLTVSIGIWKAIAPMTASPSRIGAAMKLAGASYEGA